ncbi:MAG: NACHT domain-containing protein, partial [Methanobacteriota archaeon]
MYNDIEKKYLKIIADNSAKIDGRIPLSELYVMLEAVSQKQFHPGFKMPPEDTVSVGEALGEAPYLVILGEPGSGKSTTLQFIAHCFASHKKRMARDQLQLDEERIPIWLPSKKVIEELEKEDSTPRLENALARLINELYFRLKEEEEAKQIVFNWRDNGKLILLLDGLDEIKPEERSVLIEQLKSFVGHDRNESFHNRVVITSRLTGYSSFGGYFKEYILKPFGNTEDAKYFLKNWLHFSRRDWDATTLNEKTLDLWQKLQQKKTMRNILNNPLFLRMAAENYARDEKSVVHHRAELYQEYMKTLWQRAIDRGAPEKLKKICFAALDALAFYLHSDGKNDAESVDKQLREGAKKILDETKIISDNEFPELLPILSEKMGLLVSEGNGYRFSHQTFQEYGVARYLKRAWEKNHHRCWRFIHPRLHLPEWREVIFLLAGSLSEEDADDFINHILSARSSEEALLLRDLRLAASLIGEGIPIANKTRQFIFQTARSYLFPSGIHKLRKYSITPNHWRICKTSRRLATRTLGEIGGSEAVALLSKALIDRDYKVLREAVNDLVKIGDEQAIKSLIKALKNENRSIRQEIVWVLGKIGVPQTVIPLIKALEDEDSYVRQAAARALSHIKDPQAVIPLTKALEDENSSIREAAAYALGNIGVPQTVIPLTKALKDENSSVRWAAAEALGNIKDPQAVITLSKVLKDENRSIRQKVVRVLGN